MAAVKDAFTITKVFVHENFSFSPMAAHTIAKITGVLLRDLTYLSRNE